MKRLIALGLTLSLALCLLTGCTAPQEAVKTDWSKLTPYEAANYRYYEPRSADGRLQARDDYGVLLYYIGSIVGEGAYAEMRVGLVTADGRVVTEPLYKTLTMEDSFLLLYEDFFVTTCTVAAADGSWVRQLDTPSCVICSDLLVYLQPDGAVTVLNPDGTVKWNFSLEKLTPYLGTDPEEVYLTIYNGFPMLVYVNPQNKPSFQHNEYDSQVYLNLKTGTVSLTHPLGSAAELEQPPTVYPQFEGYEDYPCRVADGVTGMVYYCAQRQNSEPACYDLLDDTGKLVYADCVDPEIFLLPTVRAGLIAILDSEEGCFGYYALADGREVFRYPLRTNDD